MALQGTQPVFPKDEKKVHDQAPSSAPDVQTASHAKQWQWRNDTTDACYNRGQAYAKNVGWRLDYHLATPAFAALARSEAIYKDERFSDHAPITVGYEFAL